MTGDLFRRAAWEEAMKRRRIARGGEKLRRQQEVRKALAALLLDEISEAERERLTRKHAPLRRVAH